MKKIITIILIALSISAYSQIEKKIMGGTSYTEATALAYNYDSSNYFSVTSGNIWYDLTGDNNLAFAQKEYPIVVEYDTCFLVINSMFDMSFKKDISDIHYIYLYVQNKDFKGNRSVSGNRLIAIWVSSPIKNK